MRSVCPLSYYFRIDFRAAYARKYILCNNILFLPSGKSRHFIDIFSLRENTDIFLTNTRFFLFRFKVNFLDFFLSFSYFFKPHSPSSIQKPPCSFSLERTVFSVTARYSANSEMRHLPFSCTPLNAVSMLSLRSLLRS